MASADARSAPPLRSARWTVHVLGSIAFALPFLAIGAWVTSALFISNTHAHLVEKALLALDRGRIEMIGFVYPPLPFMLLLAWPTPLVASVLAALAGGATAWVLWRALGPVAMPVALKALLVAAVMGGPAVLYLATAAVPEMLAILLLAVAWRCLLSFVHRQETRALFTAGIILGVAFFVTYYAILFALVFAAAAALRAYERGARGGVATAFVLLFLPLAAAGAWTYLSWLFAGDPLLFTRDPASSLFGYWRPSSEDVVLGWRAALLATARDILATPLYPVLVLAAAVLAPMRAPLLLAPAALVTAVRAAGMVCSAPFTVALLSVTALSALPRSVSRPLLPAIAVAALAQLAAGHGMPLTGDAAVWRHALLTGQPSARDAEERTIAAELSRQPPHSVLLDDRTGYRLVARAGTARPFVLPADALYALAESQPAEFVDHMLVPAAGEAEAGDRLARLYATEPPPRLEVVAAWPRWRLYGRGGDAPARDIDGNRGRQG